MQGTKHHHAVDRLSFEQQNCGDMKITFALRKIRAVARPSTTETESYSKQVG